MNKTRLEAFSDGVLAIIITIMVLELKVPKSAEWSELKELIPVFVSYLASFVYIGIYWGNHHHLLHSASRISSGMIWANLNLLFWMSLVPFVTGWMGENHFASNTVAVYCSIMLITGGAYFILLKSVERNSHDLEALRKAFVIVNKKGIASTILYTLSIPLAFVTPILSGAIVVIVSIIWLIPDKNIERALRENKTKA